jgi:predicted O-methyltransferase YrrM
MITRIEDFFTFLQVDDGDREHAMRESARAAERAEQMMHARDYEALAAVVLCHQPRRIFEIGTYLGVTSDFLLRLLPHCEVVSVAYMNPRLKLLGKRYNNSELPRERIGSAVQPGGLSRFTQLFGDSHRLDARALEEQHGTFDLVLIDGDHSRDGVRQDTELARTIVGASGVICWHDANPKPAYLDVRRFLEHDLALPAIATKDDYIGGIAAWSCEIEGRLTKRPMA